MGQTYRFNTRAGRAFDVVNVTLLTAVGLLAVIHGPFSSGRMNLRPPPTSQS
jgi:hypothetical protein